MRVQRYRIVDKKQKQLVNIYSYTVNSQAWDSTRRLEEPKCVSPIGPSVTPTFLGKQLVKT